VRKDETTQIATALSRSATLGPAGEKGRPQSIIGKLGRGTALRAWAVRTGAEPHRPSNYLVRDEA